jgi:hypothetical protein
VQIRETVSTEGLGIVARNEVRRNWQNTIGKTLLVSILSRTDPMRRCRLASSRRRTRALPGFPRLLAAAVPASPALAG